MLFGIFFVIIEAKQLDMKTILRNFFSVLRRFKTASVLNVLGLSIAFVAFMLIMMQVNYDYTFDRSHPNADAIFRVDIVHGSKGSQAIICRPFARAFTGSSPLIEPFECLDRKPFFLYRGWRTADELQGRCVERDSRSLGSVPFRYARRKRALFG